MIGNVVIASALSWVLVAAAGGGLEARMSAKAFATAIEDESTAPHYVLVTIVDDVKHDTTQACIEAPFLLGAIHREFGIPYNESGSAKVLSIALRSEDHVFHFRKRRALRNVQRRYTEFDLTRARQRVGSISTSELERDFSAVGSGLGKYCPLYDGQPIQACGDSLSHILLERGLLPRLVGCRSYDVYLDG